MKWLKNIWNKYFGKKTSTVPVVVKVPTAPSPEVKQWKNPDTLAYVNGGYGGIKPVTKQSIRNALYREKIVPAPKPTYKKPLAPKVDYGKTEVIQNTTTRYETVRDDSVDLITPLLVASILNSHSCPSPAPEPEPYQSGGGGDFGGGGSSGSWDSSPSPSPSYDSSSSYSSSSSDSYSSSSDSSSYSSSNY